MWFAHWIMGDQPSMNLMGYDVRVIGAHFMGNHSDTLPYGNLS